MKIGYVAEIFNSAADRAGNVYWAMSVVRTEDGAQAFGTVTGGESNCTWALRLMSKQDGFVDYHYSTGEMRIRAFNNRVKDWPHLWCTDDEIIPALRKQFEGERQ